MKEIRPKLTVTELILIVDAMKEAGYDKEYGTDQFKILRRFELLRDGYHSKERIWR